MRAYCQSKLAQILFTFDLAEELEGSGVTATCLHPATYMPTKIVRSPISSIDEGVDATMRLVSDPALERQRPLLQRPREARADAQAYDPTRGGGCASCRSGWPTAPAGAALEALEPGDPRLQRRGAWRAGAPVCARATGSRWNGSRAATARRSFDGMAITPSDTFISAEASAAGLPVSATAPASAANSR